MVTSNKVSAQFSSCLPSLLEDPGTLLEDVIRLLCSKLVPLQMAACDAVAAFASNDDLNENLFKRGALPILIEYLFEYDYTLEEGGVERDVSSQGSIISTQNIFFFLTHA